MLILLAKAARALQGSLELWLNAVHRRLQFIASSPEGPAAPSVCKAEVLMSSAVILSKRIGFITSLVPIPTSGQPRLRKLGLGTRLVYHKNRLTPSLS